MAERIEPAALLGRLLHQLDQLPVQEHLAALQALDPQDVELVLTDPGTVTVLVGACVIAIPLAELLVVAPERQ